MLETYKKMSLAAAACTLLGISASQAAVTLTFAQVGPDVTATWSGSYILGPAQFTLSTLLGEVGRLRTNVAFGLGSSRDVRNTTVFRASDATLADVILIQSDPTSYVGTVFGFNFRDLVVPVGTRTNTTIFPTGIMTFGNKTLANLGADKFDDTLAFVGSGSVGGNREIRFTTAVIPEPSSVVLGALGAMGLVTRRTRRQAPPFSPPPVRPPALSTAFTPKANS